jgi:hypothetical protein
MTTRCRSGRSDRLQDSIRAAPSETFDDRFLDIHD